jgi:hypothetical protein
MFAHWLDRIFVATKGGPALTPVEQVDVFLHCLFHPQDVYLHPTNPNLLVAGDRKVPVNGHQWQSFVQHFVRGYKPSEVEAFYANKDRLVDEDARRRQGAFFTPTMWVDEAHAMLDAELGPNWRDTCIVWDPAAGTGNLTRDHRFTDLILSTAEGPDVGVIRAQGYNLGCSLFQYDFLNDDASPFMLDGNRNVIPQAVHDRLTQAAAAGKRLVFLMNPPYGTASNAGTVEGDHKSGIALTAVNEQMKRVKVGPASQQLYAQFMYRCARIAEGYGFALSTVATFSVPTFMVSGSYKGFRDFWYRRYAYRTGMLFQASHFADVSGRWGVSFTVWSEGLTDPKADLPIELKDVDNFAVVTTGAKSLYNSEGRSASDWVREPTKGMKGVDAPQFSSGLAVKEGREGSALGLACLVNDGNNPGTSAEGVALMNPSGYKGHNSRVGVMPGESFRRATALYAARKLVPEDWTNQKDEYLAPNTTDAYQQWNDDAIVYALLHPSNNCTAMRAVPYKGRTFRIKNHFWPLTRQATKVLLDQPGCTALYADLRAEQDDAYLSTILPSLRLSTEAQAALQAYMDLIAQTLPHREAFATAHPDLHLLAHDAGLYQLKHLFRQASPDGYKALQTAFKALADKLRPGVFEHGFLLS